MSDDSRNTITLAGETLTSEDWPVGATRFMLDRGVLCWQGVACFDLDKYDNERRICAAVARCWFLDKAEIEYKVAERFEFEGCYNGNRFGYDTTEHEAWKLAVRTGNAHSASAAKWARIGKGAKG